MHRDPTAELCDRFLPHLLDRAAHPVPPPAGTDLRREVDLVILSDVHLGTRSCKAEQLDRYLAGVRPRELVLNGDILDLREIRKGYWPESHTRVVQRVLAYAGEGSSVFYVTGNHDEVLRRFSRFHTGSIQLVDGLERTLDGKRTWIVHGDAIERTMGVPRLLRSTGCVVYHLLRGIERQANRLRRTLGMRPSVLVRKVKRLKSALAHIARYEETCARIAAERGFHRVVTGHIHYPNRRDIACGDASVEYLNSGDWVDSLSALEYHQGAWSIVRTEERLPASVHGHDPIPARGAFAPARAEEAVA